MINITKTIRTYLLANSTLRGMIGDKIFPVVIKQLDPESTIFDNLPQIVIERNFTVSPNRDFRQYETTLDISILTTNYAENIALSEEVDTVMMEITDVEGIRDVEMVTVNETYVANAFIQKLTYVITN